MIVFWICSEVGDNKIYCGLDVGCEIKGGGKGDSKSLGLSHQKDGVSFY